MTDFDLLNGPLPSICIVTEEFVGLHKNGGLGTAMTGLAEFLAMKGAKVSVLYTGNVSGSEEENWRQQCRKTGIDLLILPRQDSKIVGPAVEGYFTTPWSVYRFLKNRKFDVVHFNDTNGEALYCVVAKKLGLAFAGTAFFLALHSPNEWILESNNEAHRWIGSSMRTAAERVSISATDVLWAPSRYLLNWISQRGYSLPKKIFLQQYVIPSDSLFSGDPAKIERAAKPATPIPARKPSEIVFFARLEERKGLRLFCSALGKLNDELARRNVSVLFLGKQSMVKGQTTLEYLAMRAPGWKFSWRIEDSLNQQQAVAYLRGANCVAVMPSPVDNSPCTIYEALQFGIPFIATRAGGIPELIAEQDRSKHLFDYSVESLANGILRALDEGIGSARPAISVAENQNKWLSLHNSWREYRAAEWEEGESVSWGVVVEHDGDIADLDKTLSSIEEKISAPVSGIVVLRRNLAKMEDLGARAFIVDELNDASADEALSWLKKRGAQALLCIRSGVELADGAERNLKAAASSEAEILTPAIEIRDVGAVLPVFMPPVLAFLQGEYGNTGFVVSKRGLLKLLETKNDQPIIHRENTLMGILEFFHSGNFTVWPLPEAVTSVDHEFQASRDLREPHTRARAFMSLSRSELYEMISMAGHSFRDAQFYARRAGASSARRGFLKRLFGIAGSE